MNCFPLGALERTMKVQQRILRALAERITCRKVAEIMGITDRLTRRWHGWYEEFGYDGLLDRRPGARRQWRRHFQRHCFAAATFSTASISEGWRTEVLKHSW